MNGDRERRLTFINIRSGVGDKNYAICHENIIVSFFKARNYTWIRVMPNTNNDQ